MRRSVPGSLRAEGGIIIGRGWENGPSLFCLQFNF